MVGKQRARRIWSVFEIIAGKTNWGVFEIIAARLPTLH
jgi:hypothetical protein